METLIRKILKEEVAPALMNHGGDIDLHSFSDDGSLVKVTFKGACKTCPSLQMTLETVVTESLKRHMPSLKEVVMVQEMPDDMLSLAKQLLRKSSS